MSCWSSLRHHAPFKLWVNCSISSLVRSTGFVLMTLCSEIVINVKHLVSPTFLCCLCMMVPAGHPWDTGWVGTSMADPIFSNALRQRNNHTCSLSSISVVSRASLENNTGSLSHCSFDKVAKHNHRNSSVPASCVITEQSGMSCRETAP